MNKALYDWKLYVFGGLFLFNLVYVIALSVPSQFPSGSVVTLRRGASLAELAHELEANRVVKSSMLFRAAVILIAGETGIRAGDYYLESPQNALTLAWRMSKGKHDLSQIRVTVPEGYTNAKIATLFGNEFINFDHSVFETLAPQGYMFPDTYFVNINATAGDVVDHFVANFERKVMPLESAAESSGRTLEEILTMASILEGEVQTPEDMATVAGILWKRLEIGMALQVDVDRSTYEEPGLPDGPLNNPGLNSIRAAINPIESPYFYYISGKDGKTYYAEDLERHIVNIQKHL